MRTMLQVRQATRLSRGLFAALLCAVLAPGAALPVRAAEHLSVPPELQREVDFWVRVYTEITTSQGFLHDQDDLGIVYRTLRFAKGVSERQRRDAIDDERKKIENMLKHLASGATRLSDDEKLIAEAFGKNGTPARYAAAARNVRFQLGQADRFREGLERSSQWQAHIAGTFADQGLPPELAVLPHVESSFDPTAYSKVGAAGLWQFMRSTGRRYLRIDDAVDERMDPFRATEAAAQLLDYNYRSLGTWPLALTAYNHGAAGMRRAVDKVGTRDIVKIIHNYKSSSFGFASRNFYPSFLAALTIDRNQDKYFPDLKRRPELVFTEVEVPAYVPLKTLEETLKVDHDKLVQLNPAFRPALLEGSSYVPKGYLLRLPADARSWTSASLARQLPAEMKFASQPRPRTYRVRSGDSLSVIAARYGTSVSKLAELNNMSPRGVLRVGANLRLPQQQGASAAAVQPAEPARPAAAAPAVARAEPAAPAEEIKQVLAEQRQEEAAIEEIAQQAAPVSAAEAEADGPSLIPGGAVARASESIDYSVDDDQRIRVAAEETIGHYADWLGITASDVRRINNLRFGASIAQGRRIKLDFSKVSQADFEQKRRAFHEQLEAAFFVNHRIVGTNVHVARRGDSLWTLAQNNGRLPTWLVAHYNPDIDFGALRAGLEIVIPKVEELPPG
jgi:membrane-bound lytic murein transglycosylase D